MKISIMIFSNQNSNPNDGTESGNIETVTELNESEITIQFGDLPGVPLST